MSILAVVDDLFFLVQIKDMCKRAGETLELAKSVEAALSKTPSLVIVDLNARESPIHGIILALKPSGVPIVAFVSHVQNDLKQQALAAGVDRVIARSAFSRVMPGLIASHNKSGCETATGSLPDS